MPYICTIHYKYAIILENFSIIQSICRCALANPTDAVIHQVERLKEALLKQGDAKEAKVIDSMLKSSNKAVEISPSRIQRSFLLPGEELTTQTPIPVDKETSNPVAEVIFPNQLPGHSPLFNQRVEQAIASVLEEWKNFDKLSKINVRPAKSCLIFGPPGTGKTHLALWLAKQINLPVVLARLDGIMSSFLGTSSKNISNLFAFASKYKCVLLLDEFDAIAKLRDDPQEVGEIKRVVNTLLQSLDSRPEESFTIAITNHQNLLDPAIWRRFELQLEVPKPSPEVLDMLLKKFLAPIILDDEMVKLLVWTLEGASGADAEMLALWIKKSRVIDPHPRFVDQLRKFAILNSDRIDKSKRDILMESDTTLANALKSSSFSFKQKEMAAILEISESTLSRTLKAN